MKLTDQIKHAKSPQEAMAILAAGMDAQLAVLQQILGAVQTQSVKPADPWGEWAGVPIVTDERMPEDTLAAVTTAAAEDTVTLHPGGFSIPAKDETRDETVQRAIAATEKELAKASGDDVRALEAKLRLLKDQLGVPVYESSASGPMGEHVPEGRVATEGEYQRHGSPTQTIAINGGDIVLPSVGLERQHERAHWATQRWIWDFYPDIDRATLVNAYAKGGPMYLYLGSRDAVMAMPVQWRRELVEEIAKDSPRQAQEVGRDILKSEDSVPQNLAIDVIDHIAETGG